MNDQRLDSLASLQTALAARREPLTEPVLLQPSGQIEYEHVVQAALAVRKAGRVVSLLEAADAAPK